MASKNYPGDSTDASSVLIRVLKFLVERFPPAAQLILMVILFVAATLMSGVVIESEDGLTDLHAAKALAGFLGALLFIIRLRLYDDVKDADTDRVENPTRPIPRGLVSVRELDLTACVVLVAEGLLMSMVGSLTFWFWAIAAAWSVLMRVEFGVPKWLNRHVAIYAISHMVVMGLIFGTLLAMGLDTFSTQTTVTIPELLGDPLVIGLMLSSTLLGIGFEWGRKFERYFAMHGDRAWTLWMLWPSLGALGFLGLLSSKYPTWVSLGLIVVSMATITSHALIMGQRSRPTRDENDRVVAGHLPVGKLRDAVEAAPGASGLLVYLVLAIAGLVEWVS